jgi:hypothetical protein
MIDVPSDLLCSGRFYYSHLCCRHINFIYICLHMLVTNTISMSDGVRVCRVIVTQRVSIEEQELLTLPEL